MKTRRRLGGVLLFGVVAVTIALGAGVGSSQESGQTATWAAMRGLFVVVSNLYRYALNADAFEDPQNHEEIGRLLVALGEGAGQLKEHGGGLDPSFDFVRRSIARDSQEALDSFRDANYMGSRFIVGQITENCVTCHTKRPAERPFDPGKEFLDAINAKSFPPAVRAKLQVASRQFSDAMKTYEETFLSPNVSAEDLATFNTFENYLRVSIGAMYDTKRPVSTLTQFVNRPDMPEDVKAQARIWIKSLETLNLEPPKGEEMSAARRMVADAREKTASASDHSRMVEFIGAITIVHRYLRSNPQDDVILAEAYYLLGVAESYVSHSFWISETDYLLEKSIRQAPKSEVARQALTFLEGYRSSASNVPARAVPEGQTSIKDLRKLTER